MLFDDALQSDCRRGLVWLLNREKERKRTRLDAGGKAARAGRRICHEGHEMLWGLIRPTFPVRLRMDDSHCEKNYTIEYADFNGSPSEDVEYFLQDFEGMYNEQVSDEDKLRTLPNLLKERALSWYTSLNPDERGDWESLRAALVKKFRRNPHRLLTELSRIKKKPDESIRKCSIKLTRLINQLQSVDEPYPERLKVLVVLEGTAIQSPTLGARTHAPGFSVTLFFHGWAQGMLRAVFVKIQPGIWII
ncbi:hypothetical protein AXG93_406s1420 [Marchantia polymorpha subsp. ruderalis]|uniref:Retrotransposon gag domain-containing protein n=1 Tax=Marchantia polymorpha subsp. ruderalis TaxID=1480154 RepID=A0A176VBG1_MARPO|nr:hypothetical protein AXG93_406s1420 [Marchantia polymorpha subsp. ruderalis]